jgi:DNA phosphorothioation-dependent restriction protein DptG
LARIENYARTIERERERLDQQSSDPTTSTAERRKIEARLKQIGDAEDALKESVEELFDRLSDERFLSGFGNKGGEEFLSYMNLGESLASLPDKKSEKLERDISEAVLKVQHVDGGWTGQHCITGRNFCTSAALLSLYWAKDGPMESTATTANDRQ